MKKTRANFSFMLINSNRLYIFKDSLLDLSSRSFISVLHLFSLNRIAVYKALHTFGGYMSDVVAAIDQVSKYGNQMAELNFCIF